MTGMRLFNPDVLIILNVINLFPCLTSSPLQLPQVPFLTVWNAPTAPCLSKFDIDLDLSVFTIVQNQNQSFLGDNITIFYSERLGLYPSYTIDGVALNGGLPQNASLDKHLQTAADDIHKYIPDEDFQGLAVVDWESWRPVWERNWDSKEIYREQSKALVRAKHPGWSPLQINMTAHMEFEATARRFMEDTLTLGKKHRANGLWGFYGFPSCYNYYKDENYTGECPPVEQERNDKLLWLWNVSSALYPNIYLSQELRSFGKEVLLYTHHRILEAMRVGGEVQRPALPVFPYACIVYTSTLDFLSQEHLVYTIGESAALGSAGVVLWGDHNFSKTQGTCSAIKSYIDQTLGPYLVNVTSAATLCSRVLCSSNGRCARKDPESRVFLHLDPAAWKIVSDRTADRGRSNYKVLGQIRTKEVTRFQSEFRCRCYPGWTGVACTEPLHE